MGLLKNIRFIIIFFSSLLAGAIYLYINQTVENEQGQIIKLTQLYALISVTFLYITLMASPLTRFFSFLPFRGQYLYARRGLGVSAFIFAVLHVYYGFFGELGGFEGLQFLNNRYLLAVALGAVSITLLTLMAATAFEKVISKLTYSKWKILHRLVYLVGILTTVHALMLGSHFTSFAGWIPQVFSVALIILLILEALRLDIYLSKRFVSLPKLGLSFFVVSLGIFVFFMYSFMPREYSGNFSLHETHREMAKESSAMKMPEYMMSMPGMQGDKTKRYTVDWDYQEPVIPGAQTNLKFRVFDASNGQPVTLFTKNYEKLIHLIIVDSSLGSYQHIHPEFKDGWFTIDAVFSKNDRYNLYLDFVPVGATEQQIGLSLQTQGYKNDSKFIPVVDANSEKRFGDFQVKLEFAKPLKAAQLSVGGQNLKFNIFNTEGKPVTTLKPYLGSFGHLVMINAKTFEYLHIHPVQTGNLLPDQNGGPIVEFMPMGIYGAIKPGIYKLFGQFNPDNNLITAEFTIEVE